MVCQANNSTPAQLGYRFPAEWTLHRATWLSWPRPEGVSFPGRYDDIVETFFTLVRLLGAVERVEINVPDERWQRDVIRELNRRDIALDPVGFHRIGTDESWCRDHGPAFVVRQTSELAVVDWDFNAWGGKYPRYQRDDAVPTHIARNRHLPLFLPGIVMEGGAIEVNGQGVLLTSESCLLNPNRNPQLSRQQIEQYLKDYYGQQKIVWLGEGIVGDDTDGHVDDFARFVDARTIVLATENDPADENHAILRDNRRRLELARAEDGRPFRIVDLPMPPALYQHKQRLPASYANFYFCNGGLLVPTYNSAQSDQAALEILGQLLPGRKIIGVDCSHLIWGLGAIHCVTQQEPLV